MFKDKTDYNKINLENIFDSSLDSIIILDTNGLIVDINKPTLTLLDEKKEEYIGKPLRSIIKELNYNSPEDIGEQSSLNMLICRGLLKSFRVNFVTKENATIPILLTASTIHHDNIVIGTVCIGKDITTLLLTERLISKEREEKQRQMEKMQKISDNIFESISDMLLVIDDRHDIERVNKKTENTLGYDEKSIIGVNLSQIITTKTLIEFQKIDIDNNLLTSIKKNELTEFPCFIITKKRELIPISLTTHAIAHDSDSIKILLVAKDDRESRLINELQLKQQQLTETWESQLKAYQELARLQDSLLKANKEMEDRVQRRTAELQERNHALKKSEETAKELMFKAETASRAKDDFLANMSHEIRTPMHAILGFIEMLTNSSPTEEQKKYLSIIQRRGIDLLEIISDILELVKINSGTLSLKNEIFNLFDEISEVTAPYNCIAKQNNIQFSIAIDPKISAFISGYKLQTKQILRNLIGNAVKFTPNGKIGLYINLEQEDADHCILHFTVQDTGIGISPENLLTIYNPFNQVDNSSTRRFGGTGLGLTICKRLIEKLDSRMWIESEINMGTTVHFQLKFRKIKT